MSISKIPTRSSLSAHLLRPHGAEEAPRSQLLSCFERNLRRLKRQLKITDYAC